MSSIELTTMTAGIAKMTAVESHAGGALAQDGGRNADRYSESRHFGERNHLRPKIRALTRRELGARKRNVTEPAGVGPGSQQQSDPEQ